MTKTDEHGNSRFFDAIAARYDELISSDPRHAWVRGVFQSLVAETVAPGSLLLDFGCGTGTDALWYTGRGYRVIAYDNSIAMMEQLRAKCSAQIDRGQIVLRYAAYEDFLKQELRPRPVAIVSNFAVLSAIPDLPRLFAGWAEQVAPRGYVIVSMLNPFFWKDMLRPPWWRNYIRSLGKGLMIRTYEDRPRVYQYFPRTLMAAASPYFIKVRQAGAGALTRGTKADQAWSAPKTFAGRLERRFWTAFPVRTFGQFFFVIFQKAT